MGSGVYEHYQAADEILADEILKELISTAIGKEMLTPEEKLLLSIAHSLQALVAIVSELTSYVANTRG